MSQVNLVHMINVYFKMKFFWCQSNNKPLLPFLPHIKSDLLILSLVNLTFHILWSEHKLEPFNESFGWVSGTSNVYSLVWQKR